MRSAADRTNREFFALQSGKQFNGGRASVKNQQRLISNAAERHQLLQSTPIGDSSLDEANIHTEGTTLQPLKILQRAVGGKNPQRDAVTSHNQAILLGVSLEETALWTAGDDKGGRRSRFQE